MFGHLPPRRGTDKPAQGRALGIEFARSASPERAAQHEAQLRLALSGLSAFESRNLGLALPLVALPQAGLFLPLRDGRGEAARRSRLVILQFRCGELDRRLHADVSDRGDATLYDSPPECAHAAHIS